MKFQFSVLKMKTFSGVQGILPQFKSTYGFS